MKKLGITLCFFVLLSFSGNNDAFAQNWNLTLGDIHNTNPGFVAIGHTSPVMLLHVGKNMTETTVAVHNQGGFGGATFRMMDNNSGADWKFKAMGGGGWKLRDHKWALDVIKIQENSMANAISIRTGGEMGFGTNFPLSPFHFEEIDIGLQITHLSNDLVVLESIDAELGLYGADSGDFCASLTMGEIQAGTLSNKWTIYRTTSSSVVGANQLRFSFGSNPDHTTNPSFMVLDPNGNVGIDTSTPTAKLDIYGSTGFNQLRLRTSYTPTGTGDTNGNTGDIAWDESFIYVKTAGGWKRAGLTPF
jgi:hypothetical protein